jgi:hypothetical protein
MTQTATISARNGVDTPTLFATLDAVKGPASTRQVPVPRQEPLDLGHPQPEHDRRLLRRRRRAAAREGLPPRR